MKNNAETLCAICLQKKEDCIFFNRLLEEECAYFLWLMTPSLLQPNTATGSSSKTYSATIHKLIASVAVIVQQSTPVPDYYHDEHIPAHWATEANYSADNLPITLNACINYELATQWLSKSKPEIRRHSTTHQLRPNLQLRQGLHSRRLPILVPPIPRTHPTLTRQATAIASAIPTPRRMQPTPVPIAGPLPVCSITLSVPADPAQVIPCGHIFSEQAIKRWLATSNGACCPNCRQPVRQVKKVISHSPTLKPSSRINPAVLLLCKKKQTPDALKAKDWLIRSQLLGADSVQHAHSQKQ